MADQQDAQNQRPKQRGANLAPYCFKPGQSGNPAGRPKGKSILAELRSVLDETKLLGKPNRDGKSNKQLLVETMVHHALAGNAAYARLIIEHLHGKPAIRIKQTHTIEGGDEGVAPHVAAAGLRAMLEAAGEDGGATE